MNDFKENLRKDLFDTLPKDWDEAKKSYYVNSYQEAFAHVHFNAEKEDYITLFKKYFDISSLSTVKSAIKHDEESPEKPILKQVLAVYFNTNFKEVYQLYTQMLASAQTYRDCQDSTWDDWFETIALAQKLAKNSSKSYELILIDLIRYYNEVK